MITQQLFRPLSSTYTSLIGCEETRLAVSIDRVLPIRKRDLSHIHPLGLKLAFTVETSTHADQDHVA